MKKHFNLRREMKYIIANSYIVARSSIANEFSKGSVR